MVHILNYNEVRGSAQCKSSVIFGGMRTNGTTIIKAKKSRNHTEILCKHLKLPIKVTEKKPPGTENHPEPKYWK